MTTLLIFFILNLVNVLLQTVKSVWTVNGGRTKAAIINAITFAFYAVVIKQLADFDILQTVIVMMLTNLIGVYVSLWILELLKKDSLWIVKVTLKNDGDAITFRESLNDHKLQYTHNCLQNSTTHLFEVYCYTQNETEATKRCLPVSAKFCYIKANNL